MFQRRQRALSALLLTLGLMAGDAFAVQSGASDEPSSFDRAAAKILKDLDAAEKELTALRERARQEKLPLSKRLNELRQELIAAEAELQAVTRTQNDGALKLTNLTKEIEKRKTQSDFLSNLFLDYERNMESRVHIAERQRYEDAFEAAKLAPENTNLTPAEVYAEQARLLDVSFGRLEDMAGGAAFTGAAVDEAGVVREGRFAVIGPVAYFRSKDGSVVGTAELRPPSYEPTIVSFTEPGDLEAAAALIETGTGAMPFDPSLGNAHKIAATKETLVEHVQKGGAIIYPILIMAALALLVALYKWTSFFFIKKPSRKAVDGLMAAVRDGDEESAQRRVKEIRGPVGRMLEVGVENMRRSRDLMEEVMYEKVLVAKTGIYRALPFIAVCAASAPLLGLLGTVTGIINTFKQITLFGSGDVKQLSGGISEALITTKFGLIVAIPSLLLHAYLSRKARGIITLMESNAVRLANEVARSDEFGERAPSGRVATLMPPDHEFVRGQVTQVLTDMLGPLSNEPDDAASSPSSDPATSGGAS